MTNKSLCDLLYAPEISFTDIPQKLQGVRISIQGKVKNVIKLFLN